MSETTHDKVIAVVMAIQEEGGVARHHVAALETAIPGIIMEDYPVCGFTTAPSKQNAVFVQTAVERWMDNQVDAEPALEGLSTVGKMLVGGGVFMALIALVRWLLKMFTGGTAVEVSKESVRETKKQMDNSIIRLEAINIKLDDIVTDIKQTRIPETPDYKPLQDENAAKNKAAVVKIKSALTSQGLTDAEVDDLLGTYGEEDWDKIIKGLTINKGAKYKSAILASAMKTAKVKVFGNPAYVAKLVYYCRASTDAIKLIKPIMQAVDETSSVLDEILTLANDGSEESYNKAKGINNGLLNENNRVLMSFLRIISDVTSREISKTYLNNLPEIETQVTRALEDSTDRLTKIFNGDESNTLDNGKYDELYDLIVKGIEATEDFLSDSEKYVTEKQIKAMEQDLVKIDDKIVKSKAAVTAIHNTFNRQSDSFAENLAAHNASKTRSILLMHTRRTHDLSLFRRFLTYIFKEWLQLRSAVTSLLTIMQNHTSDLESMSVTLDNVFTTLEKELTGLKDFEDAMNSKEPMKL